MAGNKILLVDDDPELVEVNRMVLEQNGYEVVSAASGEECKEKVIQAMPNLIVLDVMMETDETGFEVARWLREQDAMKNIPIVMLTGINQEYPFHFDQDDVWLPVDEFVEKPVEPDKLIKIIKDKLPV